jgi:hypothetical protein
MTEKFVRPQRTKNILSEKYIPIASYVRNVPIHTTQFFLNSAHSAFALVLERTWRKRQNLAHFGEERGSK